MQTARRELELERRLRSLDTFHLLILDDFSSLSRDEAETTVLFERIAVRVERRSLMITANQPLSAWDRLFPDETTAVAATGHLVHKAVILEMNAESTRRKETRQLQRKPGRPAQYATAKNTTTDSSRTQRLRGRQAARGIPNTPKSQNPLAITANLQQKEYVTVSYRFSS